METTINLGTDGSTIGLRQLAISIVGLILTGGLGVRAVLTASSIGDKQVKISKEQVTLSNKQIELSKKQQELSEEQTELTKWIFKVSTIRAEIESTHKNLLSAQQDKNNCLNELEQERLSPKRKRHLEEQAEYDDTVISESNELLAGLEQSYIEILNQKHF